MALITGRPLYWDTRPDHSDEQAKKLGELFEWCLGSPGVRLGIDPEGLELILRSADAGSGKKKSEGAGDLSGHPAASDEEPTTYWEGDIERYHDRLEELRELVSSSEASGSYVWLEPAKARWWVETSIKATKEYANSLQLQTSVRDRERFLRLSNRHRCTLFAPFEDSIILKLLERLIEGNHRASSLSTEARDAYLEELQELSRGLDRDHDTIYWSWQLINFGVSQHKLVNVPLLALWSGWPSGTVWAPPRPEACEENTSLSPEQAASLLEDVMRKKFEAFFVAVREALDIGQAIPKFKDYKGHSPVFYFADIVDPPALPEEYVVERRPAIDPLVKKCLGSDEFPGKDLAGKVAWGVLKKQNLVALRREASANGSHFSRYLLLSVGSGPAPGQEEESERGLADVASKLAGLEFTYGDEARDLYVDTASIRARQPLWEHVLDDVQRSATTAKDFLPRLGRLDRAQVDDEFERLFVRQRPLVKAKLDKELDDHRELIARAQAQDKSKSYDDKTEEYLQRNQLIFSPLSDSSVPVLRDALLKPFPYKYLDKRLQPTDDKAKGLEENVKKSEGLSETVRNVLQSTEQRARESLMARTTALSTLVGFLALAGLAEFIPGAALDSEDSASKSGWLNDSPLLPLIEIAVQLLITIGLIAIPLILLYYFVGWVSCRLPHCLDRFDHKAQKLWDHAELAGAYSWGAILLQAFPTVDRERLADHLREFADSMRIVVQQPANIVWGTADKGWKKSEKMDKKATKLLCKLWKRTERARGGHASRLMRALDGRYVWINLLKPVLQASQFQLSSQPGVVARWLQDARYILYRNELFVLCPKVIPSPRTLCLIRYKSGDFLEGSIDSEQGFERSMVSERGFKRSLRIIGFEEPEIERLQNWLSENRARIQEMEVSRFAELLEERGVTAIPQGKPQGRTPWEWDGPLALPSAGWRDRLRSAASSWRRRVRDEVSRRYRSRRPK